MKQDCTKTVMCMLKFSKISGTSRSQTISIGVSDAAVWVKLTIVIVQNMSWVVNLMETNVSK